MLVCRVNLFFSYRSSDTEDREKSIGASTKFRLVNTHSLIADGKVADLYSCQYW